MKYPFKFLDAYNKDDIDIFFGRNEDIEALYQMLFEASMVWVYGASGTGKTSLIQCGLAGKFRSYDWLDIRITRGNDIVQSFEKALADAAGTEDTGSDEFEALLDFNKAEGIDTSQTITGHAKKLRSIYLRHFRPVYLIFDQFEELFILGKPDEQEKFLEIIRDLQQVEQPVKMIFCIREEYLGHLNRFERAIPHLLKKKLRLEQMDLVKVKEIMKAIDKLDVSNVRIDGDDEPSKENVVEAIFDKVKDNETTRTIQLPYLQVFLDKLYLRITEDTKRVKQATLSRAAVASMGDINNVMREFLEDQVRSISGTLQQELPEPVDERMIWNVLSPFVTIEGTKEPILKETVYSRLHKLEKDVIDLVLGHLIKQRILRFSEDTNLYEIAHDSLGQRIVEKRHKDESDILEARRLIKNQLLVFNKTNELFTQKQINYIEPYVLELQAQQQLTGDECTLIYESLREINEQKEAEREKRKIELEEAKMEADNEKRRAIHEENLKSKAINNFKRSIVLGVVAGIVAIIAIVLYVRASKASKAAEQAQLSAEKAERTAIINQRTSDSAYAEIKKQQVIAIAIRIEKFGDDYKANRQDAQACENYRDARDSLAAYVNDPVYQRLQQKISTCK